jgi:hypothetical protein
MKNAFTRMICRLLIVSMAWMPFQFAHAGMIGTGEQVAIAGAQAERAAVMSVISRADVARELQAYGVDLTTAQDRVAALTDAEVRSIAGKLDTATVGAGSGWAVLILVGVVLWLIFWKK